MFTVAERDRVRDRVLDMGSSDSRVVAGAVVGSMACHFQHRVRARWCPLDNLHQTRNHTWINTTGGKYDDWEPFSTEAVGRVGTRRPSYR